MKLRERVHDIAIHNLSVKRFVSSALRRPFVTDNAVYSGLYGRHMRKKMQRFDRLPFRVMIENTNACGADCVFCPHKRMDREIGVMDLGLSEHIIDQCVAVGIGYVTIYGFGEPLLDKHFFERIEYAKRRGVQRVTTNTNGMYLDSARARQLVESDIDEVYISFDANSEKTYSRIRPGLDFQTVEENILRLAATRKRRGLGPEIVLSFVETDQNRHEVTDYLAKWRGKVGKISVSTVHNWTGAIDSWGGVSPRLRRDPCRLLWTDMSVGWTGNVFLCCNDYEGAVVLGDIAEKSIGEIWTGDRARSARALHRRSDFGSIPICRECGYNYHHKSPWWVAK